MGSSRRLLVALVALLLTLAATAGAALGAHKRSLPVGQMESALQIKGSVSGGVFSASQERTDIDGVKIHDVPIKPSFGIHGDLTFQPTGGGGALFNGDIALKPGEIDPVIDAITAIGLSFQAEHQHLYDFEPMVWFIHFRGTGDAVELAKRVHAVLKATATPLPQAPPEHPKTPLDKDRLQSLLHGSDAEVDDDGVVTVLVPRKHQVRVGRTKLEPEANVATNVAFEPLDKDGSKVAAIPDFGMEADEINPVVSTCARRAGTSAASTTRSPRSIRSSTSRTTSRPATRMRWPRRSARASTT